MNLNEEEKLFILEVLLNEEHATGKEFEKSLKSKNYDEQKSLQRRLDKIDNLIDKIREDLK